MSIDSPDFSINYGVMLQCLTIFRAILFSLITERIFLFLGESAADGRAFEVPRTLSKYILMWAPWLTARLEFASLFFLFSGFPFLAFYRAVFFAFSTLSCLSRGAVVITLFTLFCGGVCSAIFVAFGTLRSFGSCFLFVLEESHTICCFAVG